MEAGIRCVAILVVADEESLRAVVARQLEDEGFLVYQAENTRRAILLLGEMPRPALVLADLMTPSAEGPDLTGALKPHDRLVILPVVMISEAQDANPEVYARAKTLVGLDDFLRIAGSLCLRRM